MLKRLLACLAALLLPATLLAEPVPISERGPVDIRRTTFVVRDIEKSLPLYRDALGLKVIYDQLIGGGTDAAGKAIAPTLRLVLLRANDSFIGALGMLYITQRECVQRGSGWDARRSLRPIARAIGNKCNAADRPRPG